MQGARWFFLPDLIYNRHCDPWWVAKSNTDCLKWSQKLLISSKNFYEFKNAANKLFVER